VHAGFYGGRQRKAVMPVHRGHSGERPRPWERCYGYSRRGRRLPTTMPDHNRPQIPPTYQPPTENQIQGPPGTGKTRLGGQIIAALLRGGKSAGVTARSHKVIGQLLLAVWRAWGNGAPLQSNRPPRDSRQACRG
jgi:hypothetical protein